MDWLSVSAQRQRLSLTHRSIRLQVFPEALALEREMQVLQEQFHPIRRCQSLSWILQGLQEVVRTTSAIIMR